MRTPCRLHGVGRANEKIKTGWRQLLEHYGKNATDASSKAKEKTYMLLKRRWNYTSNSGQREEDKEGNI
jgi:hypothetical protein